MLILANELMRLTSRLGVQGRSSLSRTGAVVRISRRRPSAQSPSGRRCFLSAAILATERRVMAKIREGGYQ
jgi:hypothetical protein